MTNYTPVTPVNPTRVDVNAAVVTPTDRIRWGSIAAGLFTSLTILITLTILGIAIGLATYDPGQPNASFGLGNVGGGAAIWGAISVLISFFIGGAVASSSAAVPGRNSGVLNGMMVWIVALPLFLLILGNTLSALLGTVGAVTNTAITAGSNVASGAVETGATTVADPNVQATLVAGATSATGGVEAAATAIATTVAGITPRQVDQATTTASSVAWGILAWLGVSFLAAILGGVVGSRRAATEVTTVRA